MNKHIQFRSFFSIFLLLALAFSFGSPALAFDTTQHFSTPLGFTQTVLITHDPESEKLLIRSAETNLGDFCTDAYRSVMGADVAVANGGAFRTAIDCGEITRENLEALHPFGDRILLTRVSGQTLLDALEHGARLYPNDNPGFLQVSGLSYAIDPSVPSSVITDEQGEFITVAGEYRVKNVVVGERPLDPAATYTLASSNFLLHGGDGYSMFAQAPVLASMGDVDVLASYLTNDLNGTIGAFYSIPWGQGRISSYTAWDGAEIKAPTSKRTLNGVSYYELSSGAELAYLAKTGGHWLNENYILTADIYLNETLPVWDQDGNCLNSDVLNLWHPIGDDEAPFTGVLLGNGFSVNGLYAAGSEHENQGLFGVISGGRIDGLSIRYAYVSNELDNTFSGAGILAGSISSSRTKQAEILNCCIDSCCVKGYRAGGYSATIGGIYGHLPVVKNCYSNCSVYGRKGNNIYVGGFFGDAACYAYNCLAAGLVDGYQMVGGFTGFQEVADTSFTNCISACRVTAEAVNGHLTAGGFIGDNPYRATLLNCFWVQDEHMNSDYQQSPLYGYAIKMDGTILSPGQFAYSHAQDILNEWVFQNPQTGSSIWLLRSGELILSKVRPVVTENGYVLSDYSRSGVPFALAAFDSLGKLVSFSTFHQGEVALPNGFHVSNLYRLFWMNYDFIPSRSAATF